MLADVFNLKPAPVVGGRVVRPLLPGLDKEAAATVDKLRDQLAICLRNLDQARDRRAAAVKCADRATYERENREYKRIEYHARTLQKQISKLEDD